MLNHKLEQLLDKVSALCFYGLLFLMPLFFWPFASNVLDFPKQGLLILLATVGVFAWLAKAMFAGRLELKFNQPVYIAIGALLLLTLLGSLLSSYPYASLWGFPLKSAQAFFTLVGLVLFFILAVHRIHSSQRALVALAVFLGASGLAALFGLLQLYGSFIFPWQFSQSISFNTVGTVNAWGVFLAVISPLLALIFLSARKLARWLFGIVGLLVLLGILVVNFWAVWLILAVGSAVMFSIAFWQPAEGRGKSYILVSGVLLVLALFFLLVRPGLPFLPATAFEVSPSFSATIDIAGKVLQKSPLFGSGPGTFVYDYALFKAADLNQTIFWNVRFSNGAGEVYEQLAANGFLGVLSLLGVVVMVLWLVLKGLIVSKPKSDSSENSFRGTSGTEAVRLAAFASFVAATAAIFLYPASLVFWFGFWFLAALIFSASKVETLGWELRPGSLASMSVSLAFVLFFIAGLALVLANIERFSANATYLDGLRKNLAGDSQGALQQVARAAQLKPRIDLYQRDLAGLALARLNQELQQPAPQAQPSQDQQQQQAAEARTQQIQLFFNLAVVATDRATVISPNNVDNWITRGFIYRSLIGLNQIAFDRAVESYQRALELEPVNPLILLEFSRVHSIDAALKQQLKQEEETKAAFSRAEALLTQAIALKSDYWPAHFQQAVLLDAQGKLAEAIKKLEQIKPFNLQDAGLAFQLGAAYWRDNKLKEAKSEFERAVQLAPNFANARYFLGLIYDREGDKAKAIKEFETIAGYSDDNKKQMEPIIANLKAGQPALGEQAQLPEQPQEIPQLREGEREVEGGGGGVRE